MAVRDEIKSVNKNKREHFVVWRMWLHYLLSIFEKDIGRIPDNIGNNMLITENLYVTKLFMSSIIRVDTLSIETDECWTDLLISKLREGRSNVVLDVTFKNEPFQVNLYDSGLKARIDMWERTLDSEDVDDYLKERAARCLYTVKKAKEGNPLFSTRIFLKLRAKTNKDLSIGEQIVYKFLNQIGASYTPVVGTVKDILDYISLASDTYYKDVKSIPTVINSYHTLSQMLPNTGAYNGRKPIFLGVDIKNGSEYRIDLEHITLARNIYVIAPSGVGKTVIASNMLMSALEQPNWCGCIMDIKGNEYTTITRGINGFIVSMRQDADEYINSFVMRAEETDDIDCEQYFNDRLKFSKQQMIILSGFQDDEKLIELDELLDDFLYNLYISVGVTSNNRNTWKYSSKLNPFVVYQALDNYMNTTMKQKYSQIARSLLATLRMYWTPTGSKSNSFKREFNYHDIIVSKLVTFDFGLLRGAEFNVDKQLFRLKFSYMQKLSNDFIAYKYSKGNKILQILEESQIVSDEILYDYVKAFTLRRAQGQTNVLLGNSISALTNNRISSSLIENVTGLLIGKLNPDALETCIQKFDLEEYRDELESIGRDRKHSNTFLFVNRMESNPVVPLLKVILDVNHDIPKKKFKFITPV